MDRIMKNLIDSGIFHNMRSIHHGDFIRRFRYNPEIMCNENDTHTKLILQPLDKLENLRLHRHIERGGRFVSDEEQYVVLCTSTRSSSCYAAADLADAPVRGPLRAAVIASTPEELADRLATLAARLQTRQTTLSLHDGVFAGTPASRPRIGFLFPGQGSRSRRRIGCSQLL